MPITLGLNLSSLRAQNKLARTSSELSSTFERLSSGQRINRASDDAAGLAIADSLNADSRVFAQGVRNLNDGLSILNIADGALQELSNITFRLTELAEQAANGVLGKQQREALDEEAQALSDEYFRIAQSTEFNGRQIFTADYGELRLQAGYGLDASIGQGLGGAIGTGEFQSVVNFSAGTNPVSIVTGDFDNDGHTDFISTDVSGSRLYVSLGEGGGTFKEAETTSIASTAARLESEDLDGDGILDLVITETNGFAIYLGNGDGSFTAGETYTSNDPDQSSIDDFNGDGILDVVVNGLSVDTVSVFHGNGDGTFQSAVTSSTGDAPLSIASGDFNGDGLADVVTANNFDHAVGVLLSNGDGTFQSNVNYGVGVSPGNVITEDVNGDGVLDLISGDRSSGQVSILIGNGDGTFQSSVGYDVGGLFTNSQQALTAGDFNGDGSIDIAQAHSNETTINLLFGNGDGTFQDATQISTNGSINSIFTDDLNNDGVLDLLGVNPSNNAVAVYFASTTDGVSPLLDFSLTSIAGAKQALSRFAQKLDQLSEQRGQIGAFQARVQVAENVLRVSTENFQAAESRIRDADIAQEAADLVRLQILQQSSAAVLGQANLQPELVLRLLSDTI